MNNKRSLKIVILLTVIFFLLIAYLIISQTGNKSNDTVTTAPTVTHTISKIDLNTVFQFGYTYKGTEYSFRLNDDEDGWTWDGNDALPISNTKVALMLTHFAEMQSTVRIDNVSDEKKAEYGLTEPTLEIYFKDGKGLHTFTVGIVNPFNSLVYISSAGSSTVYMVSSEFIEEYSCGIDDMLQIEETMTVSFSDAITITIEGNDKLVYKFYPTGKENYISNNCKWFLSIDGGNEFPINEKLGEDLTSALKASAFAEIITYDSEKYADYGLAEKSLKLTIDATGLSSAVDSSTGETVQVKSPYLFSFYLGDSDDDGFSYAITDNSPLLYLTTSSVYDLLYSFDRSNISSVRSAYVWNIDPSYVSAFTFVIDEKNYKFIITESSSSVSCTLNGKSVNYDSVKSLLEAISMLEWDNDVSKASEGTGAKENVLSLTVNAGDLSVSAVFSEYSDEYYRITNDGRNELLILRSNLDAIIALLDAIEK